MHSPCPRHPRQNPGVTRVLQAVPAGAARYHHPARLRRPAAPSARPLPAPPLQCDPPPKAPQNIQPAGRGAWIAGMGRRTTACRRRARRDGRRRGSVPPPPAARTADGAAPSMRGGCEADPVEDLDALAEEGIPDAQHRAHGERRRETRNEPARGARQLVVDQRAKHGELGPQTKEGWREEAVGQKTLDHGAQAPECRLLVEAEQKHSGKEPHPLNVSDPRVPPGVREQHRTQPITAGGRAKHPMTREGARNVEVDLPRGPVLGGIGAADSVRVFAQRREIIVGLDAAQRLGA
eukprot:scaffold5190_cov113-Isochrysis_galbana.AAC.3